MSTTVMEVVTAEPAAPPAKSNLRVRDLKEGAFSRVKNDFKNPADAIEILNYIDFLAQNNSTSADDMELPFEDGKRHEWKLTRAEATQLFFGHIEAKAAEIKKSIALPNDEAKAAIIEAFKARAKSVRKRMEDEIADHVRSAEVCLTNFNNMLAEARKCRETIEALAGGVDYEKKTSEAIDGLASTNWNFLSFSGDTIKFVSRVDVMLRHIEKRAGIHYELNCGKFLLEMRLGTLVPFLRKYERCAVGGNIHPHVSSSGEVCFGNGMQAYRDAQLSGDLLKIIKIIDAMLPNYGDNPFITIANFKRGLDERDRLEREGYGKKKEEASVTDEDILDDEPEFNDDLEWSDGDSNE